MIFGQLNSEFRAVLNPRETVIDQTIPGLVSLPEYTPDMLLVAGY